MANRVIDGLRRELDEEVGVELTGNPLLLGMYSSNAEGKSDHIAVFIVEAWRRDPKVHAEVAETGFFDLQHLPPEVSPGTPRRIAEHRVTRPIDYAW